MKSADIDSTAQKIDKLIRRVDEGDIKIPAFQRGYVWKQNQVLELLESIKSQFPIGSVLLWNTNEPLRFTRNIAGYQIPDRGVNYPVNYVLDGQQRLASIYGVFSQCTTQERDPNGYNPLKGIFEISYDFATEKFLPATECIQNSDRYIKLRDLLDVTTLIPALTALNPQYYTTAQELAHHFLNYEIPVVTIGNRDKSDVGLIFERINNTGTKLGLIDLMTAWTWTEDFHLLEQIKDFLDELSDKNFGGIKPKTILQAVSAIIQGSTTTEKILALSAQTVRNNWEASKEAIRKTVDFLCTDLHCKHLDFLPYHHQIVAITYFFHINKSPTAKQLTNLRSWFWKTSFSDRYSSGQTNAKIDSDLQIMTDICKGEVRALQNIKITCTHFDLINTGFSKSSTLTKSFLLLLANQGPIDLVKNQRIDVERALSSYNRKEYHHVFPNAFLEQNGFNKEAIFCVANFCFLSAESNKKITSKAPSDYFQSLVPNDDSILAANLLPVDRALYSSDDYRAFLQARSVLIIETVNDKAAIAL